MTQKFFATSFILLTFCIQGFAQADTLASAADSVEAIKHSFGKVGISYLSNNIYLGRKDAEPQSNITAAAGYYHKSGLYLSGAVSYIPNPGFQLVDMKEISAGYEFSAKKLNGAVNLTRYFFNDSSSAINSAINTTLGAYGSYDLNFLTLGAAVDFTFVNKTDAVLNLNAAHPFYLDDDKLEITPAVNLNAGSQNFYAAYYKPAGSGSGSASSRGRGRGKKNSGGATTGQNGTVEIVDYSKFKIMDYELKVPVEYSFKHFIFGLVPIYIIPVNPSTFVENSRTLKEKLSNAFIVEAEITYKF